MNREQRARRYEELSFEIMFHKYLYFEYDNAQISNEIYDSLKEEYHRLGKELEYDHKWYYPCLKYSHNHPMSKEVAWSAKTYLGVYRAS